MGSADEHGEEDDRGDAISADLHSIAVDQKHAQNVTT
jgi:hypothetical protein